MTGIVTASRIQTDLLEWSWKLPPSSKRTLANSTAETKGTSVSSSKQHCTPNLYRFFLVMKAMTPTSGPAPPARTVSDNTSQHRTVTSLAQHYTALHMSNQPTCVKCKKYTKRLSKVTVYFGTSAVDFGAVYRLSTISRIAAGVISLEQKIDGSAH